MARRFLIFGIGFLMGCVLVYFMLFKGTEREFYGSWLPEGRVLKKLRTNLDLSSPRTQCMLDKGGVFASELDALLEEGDVDFKKSDTQNEIKLYYTEAEFENQRLVKLEFALQNDSVWINRIGTAELMEYDCN